MAVDYSQMNATDVFCDLIAKTTYEDIDPQLFDIMKIRLADGIGVTLAGYHGSCTREVYNLYKQYGGAPEASVFSYDTKLPAYNAAMVNSLMMRSNDCEPCHCNSRNGLGTPTHIASSLNPCALAIGEREGVSGKDIMVAIACAEDMAGRVNDAKNFNTYNTFDGNGTTNGLATTMCSAKILGMDSAGMHSALSIGLSMFGGSMANTLEHNALFKFNNANSARVGILAADLANAGYEAQIADPLAGTRGFFQMFGDSYDPEILFDRVGQVRYGEVIVKGWAGCCATHHQAKATMLATGGRAFDPDEVKEIRCHMLRNKVGIVGSLFEPGETTQAHAPFSTQAVVSGIVLYGCMFPEHETPEMLGSEKFQAMLSKYTQLADIEDDSPLWSKVEIELTDGTVLHGEWSQVRPGNFAQSAPWDIEYIRNKFDRNVKFNGVVDAKLADEIWDTCMHFDELDNIHGLMKLLVP